MKLRALVQAGATKATLQSREEHSAEAFAQHVWHQSNCEACIRSHGARRCEQGQALWESLRRGDSLPESTRRG